MRSPEEIIEENCIMESITDMSLTREEKLELIAVIPLRQQERRDMLRRIWQLTSTQMKARHVFARHIISTIRRQEDRLRRLKKLV